MIRSKLEKKSRISSGPILVIKHNPVPLVMGRSRIP